MNKKIFKFIISYLKEYKVKYIIGTIFIFLASILGVASGYLNGLSVEKITELDFKWAIIFLVIYFVCNIIKSLLRRRSNIIYQKVSNNAMEKITYDVFVKIGLLPAKAFEEKSSGELINRVTSDSTNVVSNINQLIWIVSDVFAVLIIFIYILFNSWIIFLEILVYLIIFYFYTKKYMPLIKDNQKKIKQDIDNTTAKVNESIRGVREIRALGIREKTNTSLKKEITSIFKKRNEAVNFTENYYAVVRNMNAFMEATVFITSVVLLKFSMTNLTFVIALTWYVYRFMYLFESITNISTNFQTLIVSSERIMEILNNDLYQDIAYGNVNKKVEGNIEFKDVFFKYSPDEDYVLKDFNLVIPKNKVTALVGKSGNGKSTVFNLLLRYFDVKEGTLKIDDVDINEFSEKSLSQNIAIIRQEPFLFNLSLLDNFKILKSNITLDSVRKYCQKCEIDDYIMSLPDGYNTIVGEGGVKLSGGQKQRLAIARALMKESKIILMDEATSALDNVNQEKIKKVIMELSQNHTILIVAHRLSTIVDADNICLIEAGHVKVTGKHEELLKKSKEYRELYLNDEVEEV